MNTSQLEADYYSKELPRVRKAINELKNEMGDSGRKQRLSYLTERINSLQTEINRIHNIYDLLSKKNSSYIERYITTIRLDDLAKELRRRKSEYKYLIAILNGKSDEKKISSEMIENARQYPINNLVEVKRGKALCPFHDDQNASMDIRNGFYYCYACGAKGDVIAFIMNRDNLSFPEAVRRLQT